MPGRTDKATRMIEAPAAEIYKAFTDAASLIAWLPPSGMSGRVLLYEPWVGGRYQIELTYEGDSPGEGGKTTSNTDVSSGKFLVLDPGSRITQSVDFESDDESFSGEMIMTWTFEPFGDKTNVTVTAENVPKGISKEDHDAGLASSMENLARFVSRG